MTAGQPHELLTLVCLGEDLSGLSGNVSGHSGHPALIRKLSGIEGREPQGVTHDPPHPKMPLL